MRTLAAMLLLAGCATTGSKTGAIGPECPTTEPAVSETATLPASARVAKVCVLGARASESAQLLELVKDRENKPLTPDAVSDELRGLVATGFVREAKAIATPAGADAVVLSFVVTQYLPLGEVKFVAGGTVDTGPSREAAKNTVWASPTALARLRDDLIDTLRAQGFPQAAVAVKTVPAGEKANVELVVAEGPRDTVRSIAIVGSKRVPEAELRRLLKTEVGNPWDVPLSYYDEAALKSHYWNRGMAMATVSASSTSDEQTGAVAVTFTVVEGDVFTIGSVKLTGADPKLLAKLETKPGKIFAVDTTRRDVEKLEAAGGVQVAPEVNTDLKRKRIDITFAVTPKP